MWECAPTSSYKIKMISRIERYIQGETNGKRGFAYRYRYTYLVGKIVVGHTLADLADTTWVDLKKQRAKSPEFKDEEVKRRDIGVIWMAWGKRPRYT